METMKCVRNKLRIGICGKNRAQNTPTQSAYKWMCSYVHHMGKAEVNVEFRCAQNISHRTWFISNVGSIKQVEIVCAKKLMSWLFMRFFLCVFSIAILCNQQNVHHCFPHAHHIYSEFVWVCVTVSCGVANIFALGNLQYYTLCGLSLLML